MNANQYRTARSRRPVRQAHGFGGLTTWGRPGRRRVLQGGLGLVAGSAAALLLACGDDDEKDEAGVTTAPGGATAPQGAEAPKRGGRLGEFVGSNTNNLNVVSDAIQGAYIGGLRVYDRLVSQRPGKDTAREYVLEAAQSVEQPDPTTVIFKLKPGMTFHNRPPVSGRAVTAEDVVKTQFYVRDNPRSSIKYFQTEAMRNGEAPDTQTVVFTLKAPAAYLFSGTELAHVQGSCIVPTELHDTLDSAWQIGSGPYELAEYEVNVRYRYKRFENFRDAAQGLPYVAEKELRVVIDAAAQEAAFRSKQAHIWGYPQAGPPFPNIADQLKKDLGDRIELEEYLNPAMNTLVANVNRPPWNDVRVREALYRYLDREQLVDLLEAGRGKVTSGPLSVPLEEYQLDPKQTEKYWKQDPRAARQLLEAAGFPFDREVELIIAPSARNQQAAEIIQELPSRAGVK
ncbi:MAG: ABC transporter substrate-binding protein, partial [Dehalococcoidia bacterium]